MFLHIGWELYFRLSRRTERLGSVSICYVSTNSYDQDLCPLLDLFKYLLLDQLLYMRPYDVENKASRSFQVRAWADSLVSFNK
jgi:hypothetical protein